MRSVSAMPKFCANLSFMFGEKSFLERYKAAKDAGFKAVESGFPFGYTKEYVEIATKEADIPQVLINAYTGDVTKGEVGFAALIGKENEFKDSVLKTVEYAKIVGAKKMHIMAGKVQSPTEANYVAYVENLKFAVKILEGNDIMGLIEPINKYSIPNYYLNNYETALKVIREINSPNLRLMLDIFHLQHIKGDITNAIMDYMPYVGHVQIAQVPNRNEPNTPGEINYKYVLEYLEQNGYNDWIGLEYKPAKSSAEGLRWIKELGFEL